MKFFYELKDAPDSEIKLKVQEMLENKKTQFHHLSYDYHAASQAMKDAGLRQGYQNSLVDGYWPSEEVLPAELRRELAIG